MRTPARIVPAFTVIELLCVLGIVAILLSMLIPSLANVRNQAANARDVANLRSHAGVFASYAADFEEHFPYITDPESTYTIIRAGDVSLRVLYFGASLAWPYAMVDYYDGSIAHGSLQSPIYPASLYGGRPTGSTPYHYGCVFFTRPEYWNGASRLANRTQWRAVRHDEVLFPSAKVLLVNNDGYLRAFEQGGSGNLQQARAWTTNVAVADGHARRLAQGQRRGLEMDTGDGRIWGAIHHWASPPHLHTIDGVRGRDLSP